MMQTFGEGNQIPRTTHWSF